MANTTGTLSAPPQPSALLQSGVTNFLLTGSTTPTVASPAFRTGSTTTYTSSSAPTTISLPLSASIVVGDVIFVVAQTNTNATPQPPTGFTFFGLSPISSTYLWVWWKVAQAGDPGSNVSWTHGWGAISVAAAMCSYSGVNPAMPGYALNAQGSTGTTLNAPVITTPVASTVVEAYGAYSGSNPTVTGPTTQRVAANIGVVAVGISDQTQGAAGSTGTQTITASISGAFINAITIILLGAPSGGSVPAGGWTLFDTYAPAQSNGPAYQVWQTPSAQNNLGSTWYLIFGYQPCSPSGTPGQTWYCFLSEIYTASNHTFNATCIYASSSAPIYVPGPGTTPPYAQVAGTALTVGAAAYTYQLAAIYSVSVGTSQYFVAANRDGFFLSLLGAGTLTGNVYAGGGTTLITNPALTDPVPLFLCLMTSAQPQISCTREPGWTTNAYGYWGSYQGYYFAPLPPPSTLAQMLGTINSTSGDFFLANNTPVASRWYIFRVAVGVGENLIGVVRGLLPAWLQYANQSGCAWGDTVTQGSDTLTFYGTTASGTPLWIDTTVA